MNRHDPQLGVFIRKHASAAALYCDVTLLSVFGDADQKNKIEIEEKNENNIWSVVAYFKRFNSPIGAVNSFINLFRYLHATRKALKYIHKKKGRHDISHAYILLRPVFSKAATVTSVSTFLKNKMESAGLKNNFTITQNVVEPVEKKSSPLPANNKIKILTVADLVDKIKNVTATIEAVAEISKHNAEIEFHIVGHGKDANFLKDLSRKLHVLDTVVFFHGVKTNEEVFQFLHACDFLVMNSRHETFSLICIEAMSCGKPVIATDSGGPSEFMNPENGILIAPGNAEHLTSALKKMITEFKTYDSELLKKFAGENFSASETGKKFLEIYRKVLAC